jgi:hypothetical protein
MAKRKVVVMILAVGLVVGGLLSGYAIARQPHMEAALASLQEARNQLQMAKHNKGGHRVEAIRLTNLAIEEVNKGITAGEY